MFLLSSDYWEVKMTSQKGRGIFAKKDIPAGTVIGDYIGKLVLDRDYDETQQDGLYSMYFNDDMSIVADKNAVGIHLINHSCSSNCAMFPYKGHEIFIALRHIFANEELTINYFLDPPEENHLCTDVCYCNSPICKGTWHTNTKISETFNTFIQKHNGKYMHDLPVKLGETIPMLSHYPSHVSDFNVYDLFGCCSKKALTITTATVPSIRTIRENIRKTGRVLYLKQLHFYIFGVSDGLIIGFKHLSDVISK